MLTSLLVFDGKDRSGAYSFRTDTKREGLLMMTWTALPPIPQHDLRLSRKENENEPGHDDRIGYREVHFSGARGRRGGAVGSAAEIVAKAGAGVLWQTAPMSGRPRGLRVVTLLGP